MVILEIISDTERTRIESNLKDNRIYVNARFNNVSDIEKINKISSGYIKIIPDYRNYPIDITFNSERLSNERVDEILKDY